MNESEILACVAALTAAFPRTVIAANNAEAYAAALCDLDDPAELREAVVTLARSAVFLPSIAELREQVAAFRGVPDPDEAYTLVVRAAAGQVEWKDLPEPVRETVVDMGGLWTWRMSERPERLARPFREMYAPAYRRIIAAPNLGRQPQLPSTGMVKALR